MLCPATVTANFGSSAVKPPPTYSAGSLGIHVTPFFGPSAHSATPHWIYEVQIPLLAHLGFISSGSNPSLGWDLQPASGAVVLCEGLPLVLSGSVIGALKKADKMTTALPLKLKGKKGHQVPKGLLGSEKDTPAVNGKPAALRMTVKSTNEAPLELKAIP